MLAGKSGIALLDSRSQKSWALNYFDYGLLVECYSLKIHPIGKGTCYLAFTLQSDEFPTISLIAYVLFHTIYLLNIGIWLTPKDIIKDTINTDVVIIGIENMAQQLFADIPRTFGNRISSTNVCVK